MSGISGIGPQHPPTGDLFSRVDSDRSGGVSQTELQKLSTVAAQQTGATIDSGAEAFKNYDRDGNGSLSGEELRAVLDNSGFGPQLGVQNMAPPPPPPQQVAGSYSENQPDSGQRLISELIAGLQGLLDTLKSGSNAGPLVQQKADAPPSDIFGKIDTDRSGTLSKSELEAFARNLKQVSGQTLDVSSESIATLDRNGDGELSPSEIDLRKTLSLSSATLDGNPTVKDLRTALDRSWYQTQQNVAGGMFQQGRQAPGDQPSVADSGSFVDQIKEVKSLLEILAKYYAGDSRTDQKMSVTS